MLTPISVEYRKFAQHLVSLSRNTLNMGKLLQRLSVTYHLHRWDPWMQSIGSHIWNLHSLQNMYHCWDKGCFHTCQCILDLYLQKQ
jgi:hypothetical protein